MQNLESAALRDKRQEWDVSKQKWNLCKLRKVTAENLEGAVDDAVDLGYRVLEDRVQPRQLLLRVILQRNGLCLST